MSETSPAVPADGQGELSTATDAFIRTHLPAWLQKASAAQINTLRDCFKQHQDSQAAVRSALLALEPLQHFARKHFSALLARHLPSGTTIDHLQWLEVKREFGTMVGVGWPYYVPRYTRQAGLLRLMQNFSSDDAVLEGSGLVLPGTSQVLSGKPLALIKAVRRLDVGKRYQLQLSDAFNAATCKLLAEDKRAGLLLTVQVATLAGGLSADEQAALRQLAGENAGEGASALRAEPKVLSLLGEVLVDSLVVELRDSQGAVQGLVLYQPSDTQQALSSHPSWDALQQALIMRLRREPVLYRYAQLVALKRRAAFITRLKTRLADPKPDLQLKGLQKDQPIFEYLVAEQVSQFKSDAQELLVPTAQADARASSARLQAWSTLGLGVANLAGIFVPVVGELLFGQLVVQVLHEVFDAAVHWHLGHQHEALEHMLGVAESVAVAAATGAGVSVVARGFRRSALVDGLEPVNLEEGGARLWSHDLACYESEPGTAEADSRGLYVKDQRSWVRMQHAYYEIHRPDAQGPWRLRHPWRDENYGPVLEYNGERCWRLRYERPLEWRDSAAMLDRLWSHNPPFDGLVAKQIMQVAGVDEAQLRGLLVEGRALPVNLREAIKRFETDARIGRFIERLKHATVLRADEGLLSWCFAHASMQGGALPVGRDAVLARIKALRGALREHLLQAQPDPDRLQVLIRQDFPGLPDAYVQTLAADVVPLLRNLALREGRLPLAVATKARALLQSARLGRAVAGLHAVGPYCNETGELVLRLLSSVAHWPGSVNLALREGSESGRLVAMLDPQGDPQQLITLVESDGRFRLFDHQGYEREEEVAEPGGIFEAICAVLSAEQKRKLGLAAVDPAGQLRRVLAQQVPTARIEQLRRLGWREEPAWFQPGKRLGNGRVGYLLSGRGASVNNPRQVLRNRIRSLFPGFSDQEVETYLGTLMRGGDSPFDTLLAVERRYAQLEVELNRWIGSELSVARQTARREVAARLRRAWRQQGISLPNPPLGQPAQVLDLRSLEVQTLPSLSAQVEFNQIGVLMLDSMQLTGVPAEFLTAFACVQRLTMTRNRLLRVPEAISALPGLQVLRLEYNQIRLDAAATARLDGLAQLTELGLSFNPLGALHLELSRLPHLTTLRLRQCRLRVWPERICEHAALRSVDLRNNQLASLPQAFLAAPANVREAFALEGNPFTAETRQALLQLDEHAVEHDGQGLEGAAGLAEGRREARSLWLSYCAPQALAARTEQWDTLRGMPDSDGFFDLLDRLQETTDFEHDPQALAEQVWALLAAAEGDADLRRQLFALASARLSCVDSVAERFSGQQVAVLVAQANQQGELHERGSALIELGRRLFRLDRLEQVAQDTIRDRLAAGQSDVDALEVRLFYRVRLAEQLDLPDQPRSMRFAAIASVTPQELQQALTTVRAAEQTDAFIDSLSLRTFWREYLEARHEAAFGDIEADYRDRGSQLDELRETLSSEVYRQRWDALVVERESALQALVECLTRDYLGH